jgi:hypothetical protein
MTTEIEVVESGALAVLEQASIDIQIATAKRFPRSESESVLKAVTLATMDEETAESCGYALERSGKAIKGPSVRCAEIINYSWKNTRAGSRIVDITESHVVAQGVFHDLEQNTYVTSECRRRITYSDKGDKKGKRYSDDMITTTCNAACSIAFREAVFKGIPRVYANKVYNEAMQVAFGKADTMAAKRDKVVAYFQKLGVPSDRLAAKMGRLKIDDLDMDDVITLRGYAQAIKDGEQSLDELFAQNKPTQSSIKPEDIKPGAPSSDKPLLDEVNKLASKLSGEAFDGVCASVGIEPGTMLETVDNKALLALLGALEKAS